MDEAASLRQTRGRAGQLHRAWRFAVPLGGAILGAFYVYSIFSIRLPPIGDVLGPRFFPFALGILFVGCSVLLLLLEIARGDVQSAAAPEGSSPKSHKLLAILAATIAYTVALGYIGYIAPTFLLYFLFSRMIGRRSAWTSGLLSAALTGAFYVTFRLWLGVELPSLGD